MRRYLALMSLGSQMIFYLFTGEFVPNCLKSVDVDDSGELDLSDPIFLLEYLFLGGPDPNLPHTICGIDRTDDPLPCHSYPMCPWEGESQP